MDELIAGNIIRSLLYWGTVWKFIPENDQAWSEGKLVERVVQYWYSFNSILWTEEINTGNFFKDPGLIVKIINEMNLYGQITP